MVFERYLREAHVFRCVLLSSCLVYAWRIYIALFLCLVHFLFFHFVFLDLNDFFMQKIVLNEILVDGELKYSLGIVQKSLLFY